MTLVVHDTAQTLIDTRAGDDREGRLFDHHRVQVLWVRFLALVMIGWGAAQAVRLFCRLMGITPDIPSKWPLSVFRISIPGLREPIAGLVVAAATLACFCYVVRRFLRPMTASLVGIAGTALLLVLATNMIHGVQYGLVHPHEGPLQYYHDAAQIASARQFLQDFHIRQSDLGCHARTHPPGAVLLYYALARTVGDGPGLSIAIAAVAVTLSALFLFGILASEFDRETARYVTLLYLLIPSVQVYYCATLDAIIAVCCLGAIWFALCSRAIVSAAGMILCSFAALFLTFGACFLLPVLIGFEWITQRSVRKSVVVVAGVAFLLVVVDFLWGFNYFRAFRVASALENPDGFLLFAEPVSYFMTRLEDVCEIALFFGPFLLVLFVRGIRLDHESHGHLRLFTLTTLAVLTLLAMFLTGAFRTGETARACLFIYPYLIFPVASYLQHTGCHHGDKEQLLLLVFTQALVMQTVGCYTW